MYLTASMACSKHKSHGLTMKPAMAINLASLTVTRHLVHFWTLLAGRLLLKWQLDLRITQVSTCSESRCIQVRGRATRLEQFLNQLGRRVHMRVCAETLLMVLGLHHNSHSCQLTHNDASSTTLAKMTCAQLMQNHVTDNSHIYPADAQDAWACF